MSAWSSLMVIIGFALFGLIILFALFTPVWFTNDVFWGIWLSGVAFVLAGVYEHAR